MDSLIWKVRGRGAQIDLDETFKSIVLNNLDKDLQVYIACDSQQFGKVTRFDVVVVVKLGNNGCRILSASTKMPRIGRIIPKGDKFGKADIALLRLRILQEAGFIVHTANIIKPILVEIENNLFEQTKRVREFKLSTQVDVNTNAKWMSNKILNEVIGYIRSFGYEVSAKPCAIMASAVADHFVKGKAERELVGFSGCGSTR